ncbi:MAG: 50S ribosomal protein L17 [Pirellulales bacterium]|nr:50S ribosomal protein L17 [Pirellulales bacterium]
MRHRRKGRVLGRSPSHRKAMYRNMASSLLLTELEPIGLDNDPKIKGRIVTTLPKAKEIRPYVEKCVTIARRALPHLEKAGQFAAKDERGTQGWKAWRESDQHAKWVAAMAPVVAARRRALRLLGNKDAVRVLFDSVAPRFVDRPGGYTRILKLAKPRLGDAGARAIIEFVGVRDRVTQRAPAPKFEGETADAR